MVAYLLWRLATILVRATPRRTADAIATWLADVIFLCWWTGRANTIDNMRHVLPEASAATVRKAARKSFEQYAKYLLDFLRTPESGATELAALIEFDEWDGIDAIFLEGKGLIAAPMHFGNWDIGAAFFSRHGYAVNAIVDTFGHSKLNDMVVGARLAGGTRVIPIERAGIASLRALRKNEVLAILLDRPQPDNGVTVTFFGAEVVLPAGVARLALRTGARVVPVAILRVDDRFRALADLDFRFVPTGDDEQDVRSLTEGVLRWHEQVIRSHPEQWYMFRRMWVGDQDRVEPRRAPRPAAGHRIKYHGFRLAAAAVALTPEQLAYAGAAWAGRIAAALTPARRAAVSDNLAHVLGPTVDATTINRCAIRVYQNVARYYVDLLRAGFNGAAALRRDRVRPIGLEHLTRAQSEGKGVIMATMHFGAPELALQAAEAWGLCLLVLTEPLQPPELSSFFTHLRSVHGHEVVEVATGGLKRAIRHLRSGGVVLVVADRDIQGSGILVEFFGALSRRPPGVIELARATGAPILPVVTRRGKNGAVDVTFEPPLRLQVTPDRHADVAENLRRLSARYEHYIRETPDQWLVLERIWPDPSATGE